MGEEDIPQLIKGCIKQDRKSQKALYKVFYGFAMGICLRYAGNRDEAAEVMNEGFLKVFTRIGQYNDSLLPSGFFEPFKAWLGRIMINSSIDHYRANNKMTYMETIDDVHDISDGQSIDKNLHYADLLKMVQQLPHAYRTVFNLFAIEGYTHEEIAAMLRINAGTSKSNLHKARQKLKEMILNADVQPAGPGYNRGIGYAPIVGLGTASIRGVFLNKGFIE
jgi:RNA polymerase sigma factor (sigma-70 family)